MINKNVMVVSLYLNMFTRRHFGVADICVIHKRILHDAGLRRSPLWVSPSLLLLSSSTILI